MEINANRVGGRGPPRETKDRNKRLGAGRNNPERESIRGAVSPEAKLLKITAKSGSGGVVLAGGVPPRGMRGKKGFSEEGLKNERPR